MNTKHYLKKVSLLSCILLLSSIVSSCKKEEATTIPNAQDEIASSIAYFVKQGFKAEDVVFKDGKFILDKDIVISAEEVATRIKNETAPGSPQTEHWRHNYIVKNPYHKNIRLYIEPNVPLDWKTAVQGAISNWNNMDGNGLNIELGMSISGSASASDTRVFMGYENADWIARAYLPTSNGRPGVSIEINSKYNGLISSEKLFAITHELGHTIGFNHTDQNVGIFIQGTYPWQTTPPLVDPNSVMNSVVLSWNGFTTGDVQATKILYPRIL
ncbi:M57 family metalloprotease [Pedobacter caeni]|uniref:Dual-action HEIGH metallo-peptidase n=1 Tax=Pedobacter caeni TaxID=288992 RepID=A0A1M5JS42_9SPHI|nr:M57 family metalloprotease [Pedobacter caeni]SHG43110.1 Dual-action HEIGH metallo-peptidase [Pedobacter caeni]